MYPPLEFTGQRVWITGASSGIGEHLARQLSRKGARVALSARNTNELERVAATCREAGAPPESVLVLPLDVTDYPAMTPALEQFRARFGGIDLLINNAGISQRSFCVDTGMDVYRTLFEVDVLGQIALTRTVLPVMLAQGAGHIAVTSSVAGKVGAPMRTGYCAAKHAVMGFFDALRTEVAGDGIRVTTITPGFIRTNVSRNALDGSGQPTGEMDQDINGGMAVEDCAAKIISDFEQGVPEIAVGEGPEMQLLALKRQDPVGVFQTLEAMAAQIREHMG